MFTFCLARGVNRGWLEPDFAQVAYYGWKGLLTKISDDGDVSDICPGTGIAPSTVVYYHRPRRTNLAMGEAPILRAGVEIMKLKPYRPEPAYKTYHLITEDNCRQTGRSHIFRFV
jgi:rhamnogalacturonyl hydrolase YesR